MIRLDAVGHVHASGSPWEYRALRGIDLSIEPGERLAIIGTNGAGKSTLASILAGVVAPSEGSATIAGEPLVERRDRLGLVVQAARLQLLLPTVVAELGHVTGDGPAGARRALAAIGRPQLIDRRVDELSGGQMRLVAAAAVLARRPDLVVLDEPLAGLDRRARETLLEVLAATPAAVAVVTHDLDPLRPLVDRVIELDAGRLVA